MDLSLDLGTFNVKGIVPYSQLTLCAKWTYNVHNDRIYKEQESQKHITTSCSGTKPFY